MVIEYAVKKKIENVVKTMECAYMVSIWKAGG